jgi:hypothetical protein
MSQVVTKELRALGIRIPTRVPDEAWVPKESIKVGRSKTVVDVRDSVR